MISRSLTLCQVSIFIFQLSLLAYAAPAPAAQATTKHDAVALGSIPRYSVAGLKQRDTLRVDHFLVLDPFNLSLPKDSPSVDPYSKASEGIRLQFVPFRGANAESTYLQSNLIPGDSLELAPWPIRRWSVQKTDSQGRLRLDAIHKDERSNGLAYLLFEVDAPVEKTVLLNCSGDDGMRIFLDGTPIAEVVGYTRLFDEGYYRRIPMRLSPGRHRVQVKIDNASGGWGFKAALTLLAPDAPEFGELSMREKLAKQFPRLAEKRIPAKARTIRGQDSLPRLLMAFQEEMLSKYDHLESATQFYNEYVAVWDTLLQLVENGKNPILHLRGPRFWFYWSELTQSPVPFHFYVPPSYANSAAWPLIVGLHGGSRTSRDHMEIMTLSRSLPDSAIVLSISGRGTNGYRGPGEADLLDLIQLMRRSFRIDSARISITGISMGGFGTWRHLAKHKDLFSCGIPMCGFGTPGETYGTQGRPVWSFFGTSDHSVAWQGAAMQQSLRTIWGEPFQSSYFPGIGHEVHDTAFRHSDLIPWIKRQRLPDRADTIWIGAEAPRPMRSDGVVLDAAKDPFIMARLKAWQVGESMLRIETRNVARVRFYRPFPGVKQIRIDEMTLQVDLGDGKALDSLVLESDPQGWRQSKRSDGPWPGEGLYADFLFQPTDFVYSTSKKEWTSKLAAIANEQAQVPFGAFPVYAASAYASKQGPKKRQVFFVTYSLDDSLPSDPGMSVMKLLQSHIPNQEAVLREAAKAGAILGYFPKADGSLLGFWVGDHTVPSDAHRITTWHDGHLRALDRDGNVQREWHFDRDFRLVEDRALGKGTWTRRKLTQQVFAGTSGKGAVPAAFFLSMDSLDTALPWSTYAVRKLVGNQFLGQVSLDSACWNNIVKNASKYEYKLSTSGFDPSQGLGAPNRDLQMTSNDVWSLAPCPEAKVRFQDRSLYEAALKVLEE